jgi:hypothetical protein
MAISRFKTSTLAQGLPKYTELWDQTSVFIPDAMDFIQTTSVGAGGTGSVTFSSIPSTYKHLQIRWVAQHTGAVDNTSMAVRLNGDTGSNYTQHRMYGDGAGTASIANTSASFMRSDRMNSPASASSVFGTAVIDLLDYSSTAKLTTMRSLGGVDNNGSGFLALTSGLWLNTAAVTSVTLYPADTGNLAQYSSFSLYGIRG